MAKLNDNALLKKTRAEIADTRRELAEAHDRLEYAGYFDGRTQWLLLQRAASLEMKLKNLRKKEAWYVHVIALAEARRLEGEDHVELIKVD